MVLERLVSPPQQQQRPPTTPLPPTTVWVRHASILCFDGILIAGGLLGFSLLVAPSWVFGGWTLFQEEEDDGVCGCQALYHPNDNNDNDQNNNKTDSSLQLWMHLVTQLWGGMLTLWVTAVAWLGHSTATCALVVAAPSVQAIVLVHAANSNDDNDSIEELSCCLHTVRRVNFIFLSVAGMAALLAWMQDYVHSLQRLSHGTASTSSSSSSSLLPSTMEQPTTTTLWSSNQKRSCQEDKQNEVPTKEPGEPASSSSTLFVGSKPPTIPINANNNNKHNKNDARNTMVNDSSPVLAVANPTTTTTSTTTSARGTMKEEEEESSSNDYRPLEDNEAG